MYNYQNPYLGYQSQVQPYQPQYVPQQQLTTPIVNQPTLNGKVVDSIDVVKTQEIPFGSYGIYPLADLSKLWIKQWCQDGTTRIDEYIKISSDKLVNNTDEDNVNKILQKIDSLSIKIDKLKPSSTPGRKRKIEEEEDE